MEYIIVIVVSIVLLAVLIFLMEIKLRKIKEIGQDKTLNEITNTFPENKEIAQTILNQLGNETTKIEELKEGQNTRSLYIVASDTILIANIRNSFTRIQTIAHECIHSIQDKRLLWANFIFANLYILFYLILIILTLLGVIHKGMLVIAILVIFSFSIYMIRSFLETEAMIKARYVAETYIKNVNCISQEKQKKILQGYDSLNQLGIKVYNFKLFFDSMIKIVLYATIAMMLC